MFVGVIFALAVVCSNVDGELILEVTPEFIEPDVTPSFTLNCALLEYEEAGVISLSIHRVISPGTATTAPVTEEIASLGPFSPNLPTVSADYPQLTALGQITTFESEMGTYLKLVWPFPTVEQLGLYQCNATIIMEGAITDVSILTPVTTSNPSIDRLLKKLHDLETLVLGLNDTTVDLQAQIDNITARGAAAETTTTPVADTTSEASPSSPDKTASSTSESNEELAANVDLIVAKMEEFNQTLHQIEKRLSILELEEQAEQNETQAEEIEPDEILEFFTAGNSTYFLFQAGQATDSYRAQVQCEMRDLVLAEINDKNELTAVSDAILPFIELEASLVLVSGTRESGTDSWVFPTTGDKVPFFQWGPGQPISSQFTDCITLTFNTGVLEMAAAPCTQANVEPYYLCESV